MAKDSFILYKQHFKQIGLLTMEERGQLLTAILCYVNGENAPPIERTVQVILPAITERIDADTARYNEICEMRKENGKKGAGFGKLGAEYGKLGGRPKKLESYNEIINGANLPPPVAEKMGTVLQYFALNGNNLKNDELRLIIDKVKARADIDAQINYIRHIQTLKYSDLFG